MYISLILLYGLKFYKLLQMFHYVLFKGPNCLEVAA